MGRFLCVILGVVAVFPAVAAAINLYLMMEENSFPVSGFFPMAKVLKSQPRKPMLEQ